MQHDFILLDRSGSMGGNMWTESINALNTYVKKLADENVDTGVTVAVFDSNNPFEIIRDRITPKSFRQVTNADATPRGGTPLNDATARLLNLAESGPPFGGQYEKVSIVIITDGEENSSQEYKVDAIRARLDAVRAKGWQVTFLGANFDNQRQSQSYGAVRGMSVSASAGSMGDTMAFLATKRSLYGTTGEAMNWTEQEKADVAKDKTADTSTSNKSS